MKNSDEAVERVLAGLREVEAPAGMERRVLAAMEERAAVRTSWRPAMGWVWGFAVATVLVVGVLIVRPGKAPRGVVQVLQPVRVEKMQKRNTEIRTDTARRSGPLVQSSTVSSRVAQNDLGFHHVLRGPETGNGKDNRRSLRDDKQDQVAEEATSSGGFPAPPMPLTEQEKLLLRVAHRSDPTELTPLNAEARARLEAEFDQEFQEFFAVPETVTDEKQTNPTVDEQGEER